MIVQTNMAAISVLKNITEILMLHCGQHLLYYDLP